MTDFFRERTLVAKRDVRCPECKTMIARGTSYVRESQRDGKRIFHAILCQPCKAFADRYVASMQLCSAINADEECFLYGSLIDEAVEFLGYDVPEGQKLAATREAVLALFDGFDAAEREERARERERARQDRARRDALLAERISSFPSACGMT